MKVIAQHERDDLRTQLDTQQIAELEQDAGCDIKRMFKLGVDKFHYGAWNYFLTE